MIPGKKVMAVYGFCDIREFTNTTEILQEKVMIFVNEIAEIVHETATDHCGSANKNIGDAFLLVWKFEDRFVEKDAEGNLSLKKCKEVSQIADLALITFLKILAKVHKSYKLDKVAIKYLNI
jgi:class 3 adenylate cyclase